MKILLVDDSMTMRRIQKTQLAKLGFSEVIEACDGEEGLKQLDANMPVDVVFLDWNMPVMNGLSMLKKARENPGFKDVKILMCTSESEKAKVLEAIQAGANDYIVKPFTEGALKQKLGI